MPTTGQTNIGMLHRIDVTCTSGIICSGLPIRERPQGDHLGTMNSASPLPVSPPGDVQYVSTERCESSQRSVPRASSTAVFSSSSSARNHHHGPIAPAPPVSVQPSTLATNTTRATFPSGSHDSRDNCKPTDNCTRSTTNRA